MDGFLASLDPWLIYLVVAGLTFGESAAFLGLIFPGEVALVGAAAVAATVGIDPITLAIVASLAAGAGGLAGYEIGRRYGARLVEWPPVARRVGHHVTRVAHRLGGTGAVALVVAGRFNQATRAAVPALAGMAPMRWPRFALANLVGAVLWSTVFTSIGFFAAEWWRASSGPVHWVFAGALVLAISGWLVIGRHRDTPPTRSRRRTSA
jgi:membrane-associated protein